MNKTLKISLYTTQTSVTECTSLIKHGDSLELIFRVLDGNNNVLHLEGKTVKLILKKSDSTVLEETLTNIKDVTISTKGTTINSYVGSEITATLDIQATISTGVVKGEILITDSEGSLTTNTFTLLVVPTLINSIIEESQDQIQTFSELYSVLNKYIDLSIEIGGDIEAIQALAEIKYYIDTNLPLLTSKNEEAVINNNNLQNSITQFQTSKAALDASISDANTFVSAHGDIINLDNRMDLAETNLSGVINSQYSNIIDNSDAKITYTGTWTHSTDSAYYNSTKSVSNTIGSYLEITFQGTGIEIYDSPGSNKGNVEVFIDNVSRGIYDRFNSVTVWKKLMCSISNLSIGQHTLKIVITGTKNITSSGTYFGFDYLKIINDGSIVMINKKINEHMLDYKTISTTVGQNGTNKPSISDWTHIKTQGCSATLVIMVGITSATDSAPTMLDDAFVNSVIADANTVGVKIDMIKLHLGVGYDDGFNRQYYTPSSPTTYFNNWQTICLHYAQMCNTNNIPILCIGVEQPNQTFNGTYLSNWTSIVNAIKTSYPNLLLTYAPKTYEAIEEAYESIFSILDIIGFNVYLNYTIKKLSEETPKLDDLTKAFYYQYDGHNVIDRINALNKKYNKKIFITEIGCMPLDSGLINVVPYDFQTSPDNYDAVMWLIRASMTTLFRNKNVIGFAWWHTADPFTYFNNSTVTSAELEMMKYVGGGLI